MKRILLFLLIIQPTILQLAFSQTPAIRYSMTTPQAADSLDIAFHGKKKGFQAAAMIFGFNMSVWAFDRYIRNADFARIDVNTIKKNLKHNFVWDNDGMATNMFMHPYHGNLYFSSARSCGYNYWQSGLFALGGSLMWEKFMENEYPSINDVIATPIGGMALGEVTFRLSDLVLDDRRTGWGRFGTEFAGFIISPMRGLTRIINGDAWRKRSTSGKQFGMPNVSVNASMGMRTLELQDQVFKKGNGIATEINIRYGDRFDAEDTKPYDYFSISANLNIQASQPVLGQVNVVGRLVAKELVNNKKHYISLGMYQHFDFYDSDTLSISSPKTPYKFGTPASFGAGLIYQYKGSKQWDINTYAHLNGVILGSTLSDYYQVDQRSYNLASGYSAKLGANFIYKKEKLSISAVYNIFHMFTWKGYPPEIDWKKVDPKTFNVQGDYSRAILHVTGIRMDIKLYKFLYLTPTFMNYTRKTKYRYYTDVYSSTSEGRLMLTYHF